MKYRSLIPVRLRVKPDPIAAAELEKRMRSVSYTPESSPFHRDRVQKPLNETLPCFVRKQAG